MNKSSHRATRTVGALLVALCGCRTLPFPEPTLEGEYGRALALWTRRMSLYAGLETRGFCRVVYMSPDFVDAQAKKIAQMRAERPDQAERTREKLRAQTATPTVFAIFYTPDKPSNDWNEKDSVWRIALDWPPAPIPAAAKSSDPATACRIRRSSGRSSWPPRRCNRHHVRSRSRPPSPRT